MCLSAIGTHSLEIYFSSVHVVSCHLSHLPLKHCHNDVKPQQKLGH